MSDQRTIVNGQLVDPIEDNDPDLFRAFEDFREQMADDENAQGWIKVYKIPLDFTGNPISRSKNRSHLFDFPWGTLSPDQVIDRVRVEYMRRGELKVMIQITGGKHGAKGILLNRYITIEKPNESEPQKGDTLTDVMRAMQEMQRASDDRFEKIMLMQSQRPQSEPLDPLKMMMGLTGMMGVMMNAMRGNAPAVGAPGITQDPVDGMMKLMGLMTSMKSFTEKLGGPQSSGGESVGSMLSDIAKISEPIALMLKGSQSAQARIAAPTGRVIRKDMRLKENRVGPPTGNAAPAAPPAAPATEQPPATLTPEEQEQMNLEELKKNLGQVCDLQASGATPEAVAKLVINATPLEDQAQLLEMMSEENFVANMGVLESRILLAPEWYEKLADEVCALIDPDGVESES